MTARDRGRWEYRAVRPPRDTTMKEAEDPEPMMNELGEEGWELAETVDYVGGGTKYLLFKRPTEGDGSGDGNRNVSGDGSGGGDGDADES